MKSWLAAYVRLHHEKKTRDRLTAMGIECFLPIQEEIHQWSDRRKKVERVVIPMMIFVRVSDEERGLPLTLSAISRYMVLRGESVPAGGSLSPGGRLWQCRKLFLFARGSLSEGAVTEGDGRSYSASVCSGGSSACKR